MKPRENIFSGIWTYMRPLLNEPENVRLVSGFYWEEGCNHVYGGMPDDTFGLERLALNSLSRDDEYFMKQFGVERPVGAWWLTHSDWNEPPGVLLENCTLRAATYEVDDETLQVDRWQAIYPIGFKLGEPPPADLMPVLGEFPWELLTN